MEQLTLEAERLKLEREKLQIDERFRNREVTIKERELARSRWSNPLVIAIIGAGLAALSNAGVTLLNGHLQRNLENDKADGTRKIEKAKAEAARILGVITNDTEKSAENLQFLVDAGLITDRRNFYLRFPNILRTGLRAAVRLSRLRSPP